MKIPKRIKLATDTELLNSVKLLFNYSFNEIDWNWNNLTTLEKRCISKENFKKLREMFEV